MKVEIDPKLCFVLIPFRPQFEEIYEEILKPVLEALDLNCEYAKEIFGARRIMDDIWDRIERARVVIAELTGRNPNVFYEVGYGHSLDKGKVILITQSMDDVPFDLQAFRCIVYSPTPRGFKTLGSQLKRMMQAVLDEEPQSPRVVTMKVEVPGPPDEETKEALALRAVIQALEKGEKPPSTKEVASLRKLFETRIEVARPPDKETKEALALYRTIQALERGESLPSRANRARLLKVLEWLKKQPEVPSTITLKGMEMIYIPPGEFLMGSDEYDREKPPHEVRLEGFYIARYPVTNAQYSEFMTATAHDQPDHWKSKTYPKGRGDHPVVNVSWYDALAYCGWLSDAMGEEIRLPTEAEWEKAARGIAGWEYPWGDKFDKSKCNTQESGIRDTTPVGKYSPEGDSPYGVADMAGNVWEWCSTRWGRGMDKPDYPYPYEEDERENLEWGYLRMLRGGAFNHDRWFVRCAFRDYNLPDSRNDYLGFRVVVSSSSPK